MSQLKDARGLDDPFYRWNALAVLPPELPDRAHAEGDDYAAHVLGDAWDFDEGDMEGVTRVSDLNNVEVKDGRLAFRTGDKPYFYWGDHFDDPGVPGLNIGQNWNLPMDKRTTRGKRWVVDIRLRQSLSESTWSVATRLLDKVVSKKAVVEGSGWQTVRFTFGVSSPRGLGGSGNRFRSLCVLPGGKDNHVAIDSVQVKLLDLDCFYRRPLPLDKPIRKATLCWLPVNRYTLFVNGTPVDRGIGGGGRRVIKVVDVTPHLRQGSNVIACHDTLVSVDNIVFKQERFVEPMHATVYEGCVLFADGTFTRFYSDGSGTFSWVAEKGWTDVGYEDSHWLSAQVSRPLTETWLPGRGRAGNGPFVDPPYLGPIGLTVPHKKTPADTPPIFYKNSGVRLDVTLPKKPGATRTLSWEVRDALEDGAQSTDRGHLSPSSQTDTLITYAFDWQPGAAGVYDLILRAEQDGVPLDTRFVELAVVGAIPQKEVAWDHVEAATETALKNTAKRALYGIEDRSGPVRHRDKATRAQAPCRRPTSSSIPSTTRWR